jgi:hypothetical protein
VNQDSRRTLSQVTTKRLSSSVHYDWLVTLWLLVARGLGDETI